MRSPSKHEHGFTLIELLIVVAIIAILAAIAVPNFLEARNRSKVSRAKADMRSLATAVEAYCVDTNNYPPLWPPSSTNRRKYCDYIFYLPGARSSSRYPTMPWLSTPIAYISSYPLQPFQPRGATNDPNSGYRDNSSYYLVNFKGASQDYDFLDNNGLLNTDGSPIVKSPSSVNVVGGGSEGPYTDVQWLLFGLGPSGVHDISAPTSHMYGDAVTGNPFMCFYSEERYEGWRNGGWKVYDATNGSASLGFVYRFQGGGPD